VHDAEALLNRTLALAAPPERVALSEWADAYRALSSEASAAPDMHRALAENVSKGKPGPKPKNGNELGALRAQFWIVTKITPDPTPCFRFVSRRTAP
jgi:hypothetical protein